MLAGLGLKLKGSLQKWRRAGERQPLPLTLRMAKLANEADEPARPSGGTEGQPVGLPGPRITSGGSAAPIETHPYVPGRTALGAHLCSTRMGAALRCPLSFS